jgi:glycerol-3-phosphate acyltransferase PlsY
MQIVIAVAYLLGAVPFGLIVSRWVKGVDLRTIGSGNIGATNAVRAMGRRWGFAVFALDFLKGFAPVFLAQFLGVAAHEVPLLQVLCGTAAVLGHCYPIYLGFKGGKGVATGCGAIVAIDPIVFVIGGLVWVATRLTTGFAGLASIMMGIAFPIATWFRGGTEHKELFVGALLLMFLIVMRHRPNIQRMLQGTEPNARTKKREAAAAASRPIAAPEKTTAGRHG